MLKSYFHKVVGDPLRKSGYKCNYLLFRLFNLLKCVSVARFCQLGYI